MSGLKLLKVLAQGGMDRIQQGGPGEGLFEESYAALQDFAFRYQLTRITGHVDNFQGRVRGTQALH
jgi:hypothetical protein